MNNKIQTLELMQSRNIGYPNLMSVINGYKGEEEFAKWMQEFGSNDWLIYQNVWLVKGYSGEIDFLIVSRAKWVMIEVKNYDGLVTLGEDISKLNDFSLDRNPTEQVQRSLGILRRIANLLPFKQEVEAALVFINTHCKVVKTDQCYNIPIYCRNETRSFIKSLVEDLQGSFYSPQNLTIVKSILSQHEAINPYTQIDLANCDMTKAYFGFNCEKCRGKNIQVKFRHIYCKECSHLESKNHAIVRSALDYCLLNQKASFTRKEIYDYIGRKMSLKGISRILSANFELKTGHSRGIYTPKVIK